MKGSNGSSAARVLNTVASLLLFLVFTVCMLIIIGAAAGTYSRISSGYDRVYGSAAAIRYISNKIRSADSVEIIEDGSGLITESGRMCSVIYEESGCLYEKSISAEGDRTASGGDHVLDIDSICITDNGDLYEINVTQGTSSSVVFLRKG